MNSASRSSTALVDTRSRSCVLWMVERSPEVVNRTAALSSVGGGLVPVGQGLTAGESGDTVSTISWAPVRLRADARPGENVAQKYSPTSKAIPHCARPNAANHGLTCSPAGAHGCYSRKLPGRSVAPALKSGAPRRSIVA